MEHDVGVIVGRFQVHDLHGMHRHLIESVCAKHHKVIVFLGLSPLPVTAENPLDFEARKQMLLAAYPDLNVLYIQDVNNDQLWSRKLDAEIAKVTTPAQSPILYGGRDSFIEHYRGAYPTEVLEPEHYIRVSGSQLRKEVGRRRTKNSPDWRAGVVWASQSRFPTSFTTVDIAVFSEDYERILLCRKADEKLWRLIGGFADPSSETFEQDARREVHEETHIEITDPMYLGSFKVDDWRYRNEQDKVKTLLFAAKHQSGTPRPDDDIEEVGWFDIWRGDESILDIDLELKVMPNHRPLLSRALLHVVEELELDTSGLEIRKVKR